MAFVNTDGLIFSIYDVHVTDDLKTHGTWEYVDFAFSAPNAELMLIWRRDGKKFTPSEVNYVTGYVKDDLQEFIDEGKDSGPTWHDKILKKVVGSNSCVILAWDKFNLPDLYGRWNELAQEVKEIAMKEVERITKGKSLHDKKLDIYEGKIFDMHENIEDRNRLR